jgi:hypothetical protein
MGRKRKEPTENNEEEPPRSPRKEDKKKRKKEKKNRDRILPSPPPLDILKEREKLERSEKHAPMDIDESSTSTANQNKFAALAPLDEVPPASTLKKDRPIKSNNRISAKDKGKAKETRHSPEFSEDEDESEDTEVPVPKVISDEGIKVKTSADEDPNSSGSEMDVEFEGLEMDRETDYGLRRDDKLITTFDDAPDIYFKDHMAPYRGLMSELKDEDASVRNEEVSRLFRSSTKKKLLVAASGKT